MNICLQNKHIVSGQIRDKDRCEKWNYICYYGTQKETMTASELISLLVKCLKTGVTIQTITHLRIKVTPIIVKIQSFSHRGHNISPL